MSQISQIKKIYHAAIYVRLSKEDGAVASHEKAESNSIANQKSLIRDFLKNKNDIEVVQEYDAYCERMGYIQRKERMVEVLQNVMENAIKYGDGKSIRISFGEEEDCKLVHIENSGCNLKKEELPSLFSSSSASYLAS